MIKKTILFVTFFFMTTNLFAAQTQIAQVNGMMCVKCQKMVTKALQEAMPNAKVKVSWPEGVAVSSFAEKSPISEEEYKNTSKKTSVSIKIKRYIFFSSTFIFKISARSKYFSP